jgi:ATP/ADP translocase
MSESNSKTDLNSNKNNNRTNKPEIQRYSVAKGKYSSRLNSDRPSSGISIFIYLKKKNILFKEIQKIPILIIITIRLIMTMIIIINKHHNEKLLKQNQLKRKLKKMKHHQLSKMQIIEKQNR